MLTLKVQGVNSGELVQMLENFIGVQVINCRENSVIQPEVIFRAGEMGVSQILDLKTDNHLFLGSK